MTNGGDERDERLGTLLRALPVPPERESFWSDVDEAVDGGQTSMHARDRTGRRWRGLPVASILAAAAILSLIVLGIGRFGLGGGAGDGSCAALIRWNGHEYRGNSTGKSFAIGTRALGIAEVPACMDVPGDPNASHRVSVYRIIGTPPSRAVALKGDRHTEYLRDS
jgi:hypothetical protein